MSWDWEREARNANAAKARQDAADRFAQSLQQQQAEAQRQREAAEAEALKRQKMAEFERTTGILQSLDQINKTTSFWQRKGQISRKPKYDSSQTGYYLQANFLDGADEQWEYLSERRWVKGHDSIVGTYHGGNPRSSDYPEHKYVPGRFEKHVVGKRVTGVKPYYTDAQMGIDVTWTDGSTYDVDGTRIDISQAKDFVHTSLVGQLARLSSGGTIAEREQRARIKMSQIQGSIGQKRYDPR
ncbi:MAG: hypothetical protein KGJ07_02695 [Patescibacteria group bacterium]|nr:hypothetical protein [Patescibacteria group bacterium]MDE2588632.1 hypothetical protein [Patescibacteria group bacterium]